MLYHTCSLSVRLREVLRYWSIASVLATMDLLHLDALLIVYLLRERTISRVGLIIFEAVVDELPKTGRVVRTGPRFYEFLGVQIEREVAFAKSLSAIDFWRVLTYNPTVAPELEIDYKSLCYIFSCIIIAPFSVSALVPV